MIKKTVLISLLTGGFCFATSGFYVDPNVSSGLIESVLRGLGIHSVQFQNTFYQNTHSQSTSSTYSSNTDASGSDPLPAELEYLPEIRVESSRSRVIPSGYYEDSGSDPLPAGLEYIPEIRVESSRSRVVPSGYYENSGSDPLPAGLSYFGEINVSSARCMLSQSGYYEDSGSDPISYSLRYPLFVNTMLGRSIAPQFGELQDFESGSDPVSISTEENEGRSVSNVPGNTHRDPEAGVIKEATHPVPEEKSTNSRGFSLTYKGLTPVLSKRTDGRVFIEDTPAELLTLRDKSSLKKYVDEYKILESLSIPSPELLYHLKSTEPNKTPKILSHVPNIRMWINPNEAPIATLDQFINNIRGLPSIVEPIFYCLDINLIPETIAYLKEALPAIQIFDVHKIEHQSWPKEIFNGLIHDHFYTAASNIARLYALLKHGGIYCDLGAIISPLTFTFLEQYDHIFAARRQYGSLLEGFIAGVPNSPIFKEILLMYKYFNRVPKAYMDALDNRSFGGINLVSSELYPPMMERFRSKTSFYVAPEGSIVTFNSLGTWREDGRFGNVPTVSKSGKPIVKITKEKLLGYMGIPSEQVDKDKRGVLLSNYALAHCGMVDLIGKHFYDLDKETVKKTRQHFHDQALEILTSAPNSTARIPSILHQIWLTDSENPYLIPENLLEVTKQSVSNLGEDTTLIIWTNDTSSKSVEWIKSHLPNANVQDAKILMDNMVSRTFFDELYQNKRFANSSILLRYSALEMMGGLYADMGTLIKPEMKDALNKFDYIFSQRNFSQSENWLGENIMASKPQALLWDALFGYISLLEENRKNQIPVNEEFKTLKRYVPVEFDHAWISGQGLSALIDAYMDYILSKERDETFLTMCFDSLFKSGSTGSWIGKGKFGSTGFKDPTAQVRFVYLS